MRDTVSRGKDMGGVGRARSEKVSESVGLCFGCAFD